MEMIKHINFLTQMSNSLRLGNVFLDMIQKIQAMKEIFNKLDFIKSKNLLCFKRYC